MLHATLLYKPLFIYTHIVQIYTHAHTCAQTPDLQPPANIYHDFSSDRKKDFNCIKWL